MKTHHPSDPPIMKHETSKDFFDHKNPSPIAPNPTTELEASRLAENVANTANAAERLDHGQPVVSPNVSHDKGSAPRVSPEVAPSMLPTNQAPVVHGGPGVRHVPGTDIVVGGPTQQ